MTMNSVLREDIRLFAERFPLWQSLQGQTVAVTGATGLLGACAVRCLLALNQLHDARISVLAVVRSEEKLRQVFGAEAQDIPYYIYDFSAEEPFQPPVPVDGLLHFASPTASRYFVTHPVDTLLTGVRGTDAILRYARQSHLRSLVYVSSLEVYGEVTDDSVPLTEDRQGYLAVTDARSSYPMGKRAAECLCHAYAAEYGVPVKIARLAQTFGAGVAPDDSRVFAQFARCALRGEDIILHTTGELSRCYCYTTDAVSALLYLLLLGVDGEAYNVANPHTYISVADMARLVCREFAPSCHPRVEPREGMGYSPTTHLRLSTEKVEKLGWHPRYDLRQMYDRLIQSLKEELAHE